MQTTLTLTRRSITLFLRDRATVFFSFLSTLILIALYFLFIGKTYATEMEAAAGAFLSTNSIYAMVYVQMMVGVLVLNSLSLSIGAFSTIAHDFESRRVDSFLLTPIKPSQLLLAYFSGGIIVSFVLNVFTWILSIVIIGLAYGFWVSAGAALAVICVLVFASFVSCSLMMLFTALVKSSAAIGVFSGVSGTFFGFLCGIYMPYELLGGGIEKIGSVLPLTHITIWLKQIVLGNAFEKLALADQFREAMLESFSAKNIGLAGLGASLPAALMYTAALAVVCLLLAGRTVKRRLGN